MNMNILRYGHDSFGEQVVNGAAWDLLPVAFWSGVAVIALHLVYRAISKRRTRKGEG
jgi:hypothetical protein